VQLCKPSTLTDAAASSTGDKHTNRACSTIVLHVTPHGHRLEKTSGWISQHLYLSARRAAAARPAPSSARTARRGWALRLRATEPAAALRRWHLHAGRHRHHVVIVQTGTHFVVHAGDDA